MAYKAWLVQRVGGDLTDPAPEFLCTDGQDFAWTKDPAKSVRFVREIDALWLASVAPGRFPHDIGQWEFEEGEGAR